MIPERDAGVVPPETRTLASAAFVATQGDAQGPCALWRGDTTADPGEAHRYDAPSICGALSHLTADFIAQISCMRRTRRVGLPVLALSADEVLWALLRAGFLVSQRTAEQIIVERSLRVVVVPVERSLSPEALSTLLREAGITYSDLLELVGEAPTTPASPSAPGASGVRMKSRT